MFGKWCKIHQKRKQKMLNKGIKNLHKNGSNTRFRVAVMFLFAFSKTRWSTGGWKNFSGHLKFHALKQLSVVHVTFSSASPMMQLMLIPELCYFKEWEKRTENESGCEGGTKDSRRQEHMESHLIKFDAGKNATPGRKPQKQKKETSFQDNANAISHTCTGVYICMK